MYIKWHFYILECSVLVFSVRLLFLAQVLVLFLYTFYHSSNSQFSSSIPFTLPGSDYYFSSCKLFIFSRSGSQFSSCTHFTFPSWSSQLSSSPSFRLPSSVHSSFPLSFCLLLAQIHSYVHSNSYCFLAKMLSPLITIRLRSPRRYRGVVFKHFVVGQPYKWNSLARIFSTSRCKCFG